MSEPRCTAEIVATIAREHPGQHPYTLSLLLQARYGRVLEGREVARILAGLIPVQIGS